MTNSLPKKLPPPKPRRKGLNSRLFPYQNRPKIDTTKKPYHLKPKNNKFTKKNKNLKPKKNDVEKKTDKTLSSDSYEYISDENEPVIYDKDGNKLPRNKIKVKKSKQNKNDYDYDYLSDENESIKKFSQSMKPSVINKKNPIDFLLSRLFIISSIPLNDPPHINNMFFVLI